MKFQSVQVKKFLPHCSCMTDDYEDLLEKGMEEVPDDAGTSERFELPVVDTRKDGSKTCITNFGEIADKINRDEDRFSKYLQNELGTAARVEKGEMILNGELRRGNIQSKVKQFANDYVFCPECESPDTKIIKEKGVEILKCQACGARNPLEG
jgi:translation initiation factor 2 subunit 2